MPDDDASGAGDYPPAPLPPHERTWRHPSEIGGASWAHTEPPLAIGRGLLIATGAIGGLLSLAVLWAMLPSAGRGGLSAPTVVTSTANDLPAAPVTARPDTLVATSIDTGRVPITTVRSAPTTAPVGSDISPTTTLAEPLVTAGSEPLEQGPAEPVAVSIGDSLLVTTARAVPPGRSSITITGADGQAYEATVVMVDRDHGIAVLSSGGAMASTFGIGPAASAGDVVTVLAALPTSVSVRADGAGHLFLDEWTTGMAEGTPVLNADGLLVGMCSHGSSGPELVSVANVATMLKSFKPPATNSPWMGIHVVAGQHGTPTIDSVDPDGPAAEAGLVPGDAIAAVDGAAVATVDQLKTAIAGHAVGDVVTLGITHADQTSADVDITLVAAPSM